MFLTVLPTDLSLEILGDWCQHKEIGILDSAACSSEIRPQIIEYFSNKRIKLTAFSRKVVVWMNSRNIEPFKFDVYDSDFCEWIGVSCSGITQINMPYNIHNLKNLDKLIQIINASRKLTSFKTYMVSIFKNNRFNPNILSRLTNLTLCHYPHSDHVDPDLFFITKHFSNHCHSLVSVSICLYWLEGYFIDASIMSNFLKCNPNLESVELSFNLQNFDQSFISIVLSNCLKISSFEFNPKCVFNDVLFMKDVLSTERQQPIKYFKLENDIKYIFNDNGKHLTLHHCLPTTQFVVLFSHCTSITHLKLECFTFLDGDIIKSIAKYCTQLESIAIEFEESNMRIDVLMELFTKCNMLTVFSMVGGENQFKNVEVMELFKIPNQIVHVTFNIQNEYNYDTSDLLIDILEANPQITHFDCHRWCEDRFEAFQYLKTMGRWIYL